MWQVKKHKRLADADQTRSNQTQLPLRTTLQAQRSPTVLNTVFLCIITTRIVDLFTSKQTGLDNLSKPSACRDARVSCPCNFLMSLRQEMIKKRQK